MMWDRGAVPQPHIVEEILGERIPERIVEQTVDLAVSSGEAGSSRPGKKDTTIADATAVGKSVDEARSLGSREVRRKIS